MITNTATPRYKADLQKALIDTMNADQIYLEDIMRNCEDLPTFRRELAKALDITISDLYEMVPLD